MRQAQHHLPLLKVLRLLRSRSGRWGSESHRWVARAFRLARAPGKGQDCAWAHRVAAMAGWVSTTRSKLWKLHSYRNTGMNALPDLSRCSAKEGWPSLGRTGAEVTCARGYDLKHLGRNGLPYPAAIRRSRSMPCFGPLHAVFSLVQPVRCGGVDLRPDVPDTATWKQS